MKLQPKAVTLTHTLTANSNHNMRAVYLILKARDSYNMVAKTSKKLLFQHIKHQKNFYISCAKVKKIWPKWPNTKIFGNFQQKNTVSEINVKVPLFLKLEFQKLEFLISFATVALLSQICVIKKNYAVLELSKLEYLATQYSSISGSSKFFLKKNLHNTRAQRSSTV